MSEACDVGCCGYTVAAVPPLGVVADPSVQAKTVAQDGGRDTHTGSP
jgi:hypothetical protein